MQLVTAGEDGTLALEPGAMQAYVFGAELRLARIREILPPLDERMVGMDKWQTGEPAQGLRKSNKERRSGMRKHGLWKRVAVQ